MSTDFTNVIKFFHGTDIRKITNDEISNVNIISIYNYDNYMLEYDHRFIQWVFPTFRQSEYNNTAPVISLKEIEDLRKDPIIIEWLIKFKNKLFIYWGLIKHDDLEMGINGNILLLNGHNGLRLSRAIECLTLFNIDISEIFPILDQNIKNKNLKPFCEIYKGKMTPLWFIRYDEALIKKQTINH